jgi:uncharacterized lipoprotein YmbA
MNMHAFQRCCLIAGLTMLLLAGCASSPATSFYALEPLPLTGKESVGGPLVGVGPMGVATYLRRPQLVSRGADGEVRVDDFNRWLEPLDDALPRLLTHNLAVLLPQAAFVEVPALSTVRPSLRVLVGITRFEVDASGRALLEAQWGIDDRQTMLFGPRRQVFFEPVGGAGEPRDQVRALQSALEQFSRAIADEVPRWLPDDGAD